MHPRINRRSLLLAALISSSAISPGISNATIVEFQTVMGNFEVNLYDNATPATVANFLGYVNNGAYTNSVYHRSLPGFVVQGGGFTFDMTVPLNSIPTNPPVTNEPEFSNVRGTIAMAKQANDPNSATNQWFINLADNSTGLDDQNGGFTAFGEVVGSGMDVIDAIAALPTYDFGAPTGDLPLRNYTANDFANNVPLDSTHLVIVNAIVISDSTVDSAAGLNPPLNTANTGGGAPPPPPTASGGGGGGSFGIFGLLALLFGYRFRRP
ncbi:MAG: peptidylprolyl isomerase [Proteobacteria bacterium]|nr:peptidylprolyl isomerase [Pseudomonadota bacterium]